MGPALMDQQWTFLLYTGEEKRTTEGLHIIFLGILGWGRLAGMETHNGLANQRCRKFGSAWKKAFRQEQIKDSSKQENIAQGEI